MSFKATVYYTIFAFLLLGGETTDVLGQTVILDTMEALRGRRWAKLKQKLPEERSRFSLQRIPQKFLLT